MSFPELKSLQAEGQGPQERDAFVCSVNEMGQGVLRHGKVASIVENADGSQLLLLGAKGNVVVRYPTSEVLGCWLDFPYKEHFSKRLGPMHVLEVDWMEWEWPDEHGGIRKNPDNKPRRAFIPCDATNTSKNPIVAFWGVPSHSDIYRPLGWLRAERVAQHNLADNPHYPDMFERSPNANPS